MRIQGIDHVEYYVGDLSKTAATFCEAYGFRVAGLPAPGAQAEPGPPASPGLLASPGSAPAAGPLSMLLRQGQIQLLLTAPASDDDPAAEYVRRHGDGVGVIAFRVGDVARAFGEAVAAGAEPVAAPAYASTAAASTATAGASTTVSTGGGRVGTAVVSGFGDVTHKLVERDGRTDEFAPGVIRMTPAAAGDGLLAAVDHVAVCLPAGQLDGTVRFYQDVFGLAQTFDERIEVGGQAMLSKVVQDPQRTATFTLIEPDLRLEPGQIDEFLAAHGGAGVQHLALRTDDITGAIRTLSGRGVEFLQAPDGYYRSLESRLGDLAIPAAELRKLNVLADSDPWGQMFQIFTRSTHERQTFFLELIERRGGRTFGTRNIQALYEALDDARAGRLS